MMRDPQKTIGNLMDKQSVCYLSAVDAEGFPETKAMLWRRIRKGIHILYFSTNTSSAHVAQLKTNPKACVYFCDRRFFRGVVLKGTMEIMEDKEHKEMLWEAGDTQYYAEGAADPDYCVLKFTAVSGRYYSAFKSENFEIDTRE